MEFRYKIGDKVVIDYSNIEFIHPFKCRNVVGIVTEYSSNRNSDTPYWVCSEEIPTGVYCAVKCLASELNNSKIIITTDGKTTTAKIYEDGKVIKTATAKCNPEDEFDFMTGAKLAFERLEKKVKPIEVDGFKVGDRVNFNGHNGTVICLAATGDGRIGVEFDDAGYGCHNCGAIKLLDGKPGTKNNCRWLCSYVVAHGEAPKYFNGKVVCVDNGNMPNHLTVGKTYTFVNGNSDSDIGVQITAKPVIGVDDLNSRFTKTMFIQLVED